VVTEPLAVVREQHDQGALSAAEGSQPVQDASDVVVQLADGGEVAVADRTQPGVVQPRLRLPLPFVVIQQRQRQGVPVVHVEEATRHVERWVRGEEGGDAEGRLFGGQGRQVTQDAGGDPGAVGQ